MNPPLELRGVTVRYGPATAVEGIDLVLAPGEVVAVLGPSGCGKTSLLRAVAGLEPLAAGSLRAGDRDLAPLPPERRGVGLVFQDHALFPHRDVAANVGFGLRVRGATAREVGAAVEAALELVGLAGYGGRAVASLSGGEAQRVALARALAARPGILLLDEPLGALDRPLRERLTAELAELVRRLGLQVLHVTHDLGEAFTIADRVAVMAAGRLLQVDRPAALWRDPSGPEVAAFLGLHRTLPVVVAGGELRSAVGSAPTPLPDGPHEVLVPPDRVRLVEGGRPGRVVAATFQGVASRVSVAVAGTTLDAVVPGPPPTPGDAVGVVVDLAGLLPLGPSPAARPRPVASPPAAAEGAGPAGR